MGRLFVVVVSIVVVGAYLAILRTPVGDFVRMTADVWNQEMRGSDAPASEQAGNPETTSPRRSAYRRSASQEAVRPTAGSEETPSSLTALESPTLYVLSDGASVYPSNSSSDAVLTSLKRGDPVRPGLQVLSTRGLWTQIQLDGRVSGFVRSEDLGVGNAPCNRLVTESCTPSVATNSR